MVGNLEYFCVAHLLSHKVNQIIKNCFLITDYLFWTFPILQGQFQLWNQLFYGFQIFIFDNEFLLNGLRTNVWLLELTILIFPEFIAFDHHCLLKLAVWNFPFLIFKTYLRFGLDVGWMKLLSFFCILYYFPHYCRHHNTLLSFFPFYLSKIKVDNFFVGKFCQFRGKLGLRKANKQIYKRNIDNLFAQIVILEYVCISFLLLT